MFKIGDKVKIKHHPNFEKIMDKAAGWVTDAHQGMVGEVRYVDSLVDVRLSDGTLILFPPELVELLEPPEPFKGELVFEI